MGFLRAVFAERSDWGGSDERECEREGPYKPSSGANPTFVAGLLIAQWMKVVLNFVVERRWDLRILWASGGMPSSHSALCTALTTSVALCHGLSDPLFPVCLGFSLIVMFDATGAAMLASKLRYDGLWFEKIIW